MHTYFDPTKTSILTRITRDLHENSINTPHDNHGARSARNLPPLDHQSIKPQNATSRKRKKPAAPKTDPCTKNKTQIPKHDVFALHDQLHAPDQNGIMMTTYGMSDDTGSCGRIFMVHSFLFVL